MSELFFISIGFECPSYGCCEQLGGLFTVSDLTAGADPVEFQGEATCGSCGTHFTVHGWATLEGASASIAGNADVAVSASVAPDPVSFDFADLEPPDDPHLVFVEGRQDLANLVKQFDRHDYVPGEDIWWAVPGTDLTFWRMELMQHFALIEAYLADTLIRLVEQEPEIAERMLAGARDLRGIKISLDDAWRNPHAPRDAMRNALRDVHYHNFAKVAELYKIALQRDILPEGDDRDALMQAALIRHDCVHRNGYDKHGDRHGDLRQTNAVVERLFEDIAKRIEDAIIERAKANDPW